MTDIEIIAADANPLLQAVISGKARTIIEQAQARFVTTQFSMDEVRKYLPQLVQRPDFQRAGATGTELLSVLEALPVEVFTPYHYKSFIPAAQKAIRQIDPKDVDIVALALMFRAAVWSNDPHFKQAGIRCYSTEELLGWL